MALCSDIWHRSYAYMADGTSVVILIKPQRIRAKCLPAELLGNLPSHYLALADVLAFLRLDFDLVLLKQECDVRTAE